MTNKPWTFAAGFLLVCGSISAHHGTNASYDMSKLVTMTGTVTEFVWTNPHCQLYFDVKDEKGDLVHWGGEGGSPGVLEKAGWNRKFLKPGDQITITVHPSKAGTPFGVIEKLVLPDGRTFDRVLIVGEAK
jgi:hypothetical protein